MGRPSRVMCVCAACAACCLLGAVLGCRAAVVNDPETEAMVETAVMRAGVDASDVAAVVSGTVITQRGVDEILTADRVRLGYENDAAWNAYLQSAGLTEWDARAGVIKSMVDNILVENEAARLGIDVEDDLAKRIESAEKLYPTHADFVDAIEAKGYSESSYRAAVRRSLLWNALRKAIIPDPQPTEEQICQYAAVVAPTLAGRRSSHILFSSDDYAAAVEVSAQLADGADFAELARAYSIDSTAENGGDMGWDSVNPPVSSYQRVLDTLEPGDISGIVRTRFGYHIIMCTDKYVPVYDENGEIDLDAIPADLMDIIVRSMNESLSTQMFIQYIANLEASAPIAVFNEDGEQIPLTDVGLTVEEVVAPPDIDEVVSSVQATVQQAVEQGTTAIKVSSLVSDPAASSSADPVAVDDPVATPGVHE